MYEFNIPYSVALYGPLQLARVTSTRGNLVRLKSASRPGQLSISSLISLSPVKPEKIVLKYLGKGKFACSFEGSEKLWPLDSSNVMPASLVLFNYLASKLFLETAEGRLPGLAVDMTAEEARTWVSYRSVKCRKSPHQRTLFLPNNHSSTQVSWRTKKRRDSTLESKLKGMFCKVLDLTRKGCPYDTFSSSHVPHFLELTSKSPYFQVLLDKDRFADLKNLDKSISKAMNIQIRCGSAKWTRLGHPGCNVKNPPRGSHLYYVSIVQGTGGDFETRIRGEVNGVSIDVAGISLWTNQTEARVIQAVQDAMKVDEKMRESHERLLQEARESKRRKLD